MDRTTGNIPLAVGLIRHAAGLLQGEQEMTTAKRLIEVVDDLLRLRPLAATEEISPEDACLIAAIPLDTLGLSG